MDILWAQYARFIQSEKSVPTELRFSDMSRSNEKSQLCKHTMFTFYEPRILCLQNVHFFESQATIIPKRGGGLVDPGCRQGTRKEGNNFAFSLLTDRETNLNRPDRLQATSHQRQAERSTG